MNNIVNKKFVSVKELSTIINFGQTTIRKMIKSGEIESHRLGGKILLDPDEIIKKIKEK